MKLGTGALLGGMVPVFSYKNLMEGKVMKKRNWKLAAALTLAAALALGGCSSGADVAESSAGETQNAETQQEAGAEEADTSGGEITKDDIIIASKSDIKTLDPMGTNDTTSSVAHRHIYSRLVEINENAEVVGDLAESWEQVSDTEWKFKLREGVKFHDGTECTANDVKFSLERAKEMPRVKQYVEQIEEIVVEDDYNLTLKLNVPYAPLLSSLSHTGTSIIPEAAVTEQGEAFWENPVGTGPMKFVEWAPNDHWTLERYDEYFKGPGLAHTITMKIMPEGGARTIALETGEIDMSISVDAADVQNVEANPDLKAMQKTSISVEYLAMNCEKAPFDNPLVRQAVNYAINKNDIIDVVMEGRGTPANSVININIPGYSEDVEAYPYDVEKAKELLAEAGYADGFTTTLFASGDVRNREAQLIQAQLQEIGIQVDIQLYEWGAFLDAINNGEHEMFLSSWSNATMDPDASVFPLFHSKNFGATGNRAFYSNPEVDQMIEEAQMESDQEKRMELYKEIQQKINEDAPWVPVFYGTSCTGIRADLKGYVMHPASADHYENLHYESN